MGFRVEGLELQLIPKPKGCKVPAKWFVRDYYFLLAEYPSPNKVNLFNYGRIV